MSKHWKLVIFSLSLVAASLLIVAPNVARAGSRLIGVTLNLHLGSTPVASKSYPPPIVQSKVGGWKGEARAA
jgi:hypothetical protein